MNALRRHAADPDAIAKSTGLVNFLRGMVRSSHQRQRDHRRRERVWLAALSAQVRKPGVLQRPLELKFARPHILV
ncbi:hypothetical protein ABZT45_42835 [Streptomyces sp. NPDC005356]|uniref:hypothetical protein n=1 Tax=Streptomyces sp. NPDC005356 TaxID=3157167 RepID=UPI0033A96451